MRLDEFRRIKLKVTKNDTIIYEGEAEELPEELKGVQAKSVKVQPELAIIELEDEI